MLRTVKQSILATMFVIPMAILAGVTTSQPVHAQTSLASRKPLPLRELYTTVDDKYLYTANWNEADNAGKLYGFTFSSNRTLGYIFTANGNSTDTQPLYRLKQVSNGSRLVTPSASERDSLVASQRFVLEGTIGYLYKSAQPNTVQLFRYSNGKGWRVATSSPGASYHLDGPIGYALKSYTKVGAYYFGMFNQEGSENIRAGTRAVYGRDDWWGGVKDFYGQEPGVPQDTRGWTGDFSYLKPQIGYYDNSDPAVLEQHINQAVNHGLNYFDFYYYWSNAEKKPAIDGGLKAFLAASNRSQMQFTISPCFHQTSSGSLSLQPADFQTAANYIAEVAAEPNFLTTQSGRPLIFMCDTRGIDNGNIASANQFTALLSQTIQQRTGKKPFLMMHTEYGSAYVQQLAGDGLTCLNYGKSIVNGSYQMYLNDLKNYFTTFDAQRPTLRCAMSNFDERPRTDIAIPASSVRYFRDFDSTKFATALQLTKESMAAAPPREIDDYLTLYAWNVWHEGGIIEPNVRDGDLYLRQIQQVFTLPTE